MPLKRREPVRSGFRGERKERGNRDGTFKEICSKRKLENRGSGARRESFLPSLSFLLPSSYPPTPSILLSPDWEKWHLMYSGGNHAIVREKLGAGGRGEGLQEGTESGGRTSF